MSEIRIADLFAGIGGIRMGMVQALGDAAHVVYSSEWNKYSVQTYEANWHDENPVAGDITKVDEHDVPDIDLLLAGFPCQPFSIAGVSKKQSMGRPTGFEDKTQGTLFFDVARIIKAKQPKAFLLENVKNLLSHDRGRTFKTIYSVLTEDLGYHVTYKLIDAAGFVPQHRERTYIVGFREENGFTFDDVKPIAHGNVGSILLPASQVPRQVCSERQAVDVPPELQEEARGRRQRFRIWHGRCRHPTTTRTLSARYGKDGSEILVSRGEGKNPPKANPARMRATDGLPGFVQYPGIRHAGIPAVRQLGRSAGHPSHRRGDETLPVRLIRPRRFLSDWSMLMDYERLRKNRRLHRPGRGQETVGRRYRRQQAATSTSSAATTRSEDCSAPARIVEPHKGTAYPPRSCT